MRILHFSDFHLNGAKIDSAKRTVELMVQALTNLIQKESKVDLVIFTGDMLDKGGVGFSGGISEGFQSFMEIVIKPIMTALELPLSRFIFTPGNHDIDTTCIDKLMEKSLDDYMNDFNKVITVTGRKEIDKYTERVKPLKNFENQYYDGLDGISYNVYGRLTSTFNFSINGWNICVSSLNSAWRFGRHIDDKDIETDNQIVLGLNQITEHCPKVSPNTLNIGITHYPINHLALFEQKEVKDGCSKHFDILLTGHTHSGYVEFVAPSSDKAYLDINSSGTLAANTYEPSADYKNAFQIIDCEPTKTRYEIKTYRQEKYEEFILAQSDERIYPNEQELLARHARFLSELDNKNRELEKNKICPFVPIQDFVSREGNAVMAYPFETCSKIEQIQEKLKSGVNLIRFMALSGMGKTRIIAETFKGFENVYYSETGDCEEAFETLLQIKNPSVVIVDECNINQLERLYTRREMSRNKPRLITIHNVLTSKEMRLPGSGEVITLEYKDTAELIDKLIDKEESIKSNPLAVQMVKERSCNIPYMAILLIKAYKEKGSFIIENGDSALKAILYGREEPSEDKNNVLRSISLFDPLGYQEVVKDEYDFVTHSYNIHHIALAQPPIDLLFSDTIHDFAKRQLIEQYGYCIRLRPRPLAEWLTETWLADYGDGFAVILDEIKDLKDDSLSKRLGKALASRFEEMAESANAKRFIDKINNLENGSFHNERIVLSGAGSQLFLSMSNVSPVAISENIWDIVNSKDVEWLHTNLDGDARRNLVWALENACIKSEEAFYPAARSLAKLAVAENEGISNNATGQFLQLFHIFLPGTKANLKDRITLLQELREENIYLPLIVKAISQAFVAKGFSRFSTFKSSALSDTPEDYVPSSQEVHKYVKDAADVLIYVSEQDEGLLPEIMKVLPEHVHDFAVLYEMPTLFRLIDVFSKKGTSSWPEMRDSLSMYLQLWSNGNASLEERTRSYLSLLAPTDFAGRVKAALADNRYNHETNATRYHEGKIELMAPFAEEFIENELYDKSEIAEVINDRDNQYWFLGIAIGRILETNQALIDKVLDGLFEVILSQTDDMTYGFITTVLRSIKDHDSVEQFEKHLESAGRFSLAAAVLGVMDDKDVNSNPHLDYLLVNYSPDKFDDNCINRYLWQCSACSLQATLDIYDKLKSIGVNDDIVSSRFIVEHLYSYELGDDDKLLKRAEAILLSIISSSENHTLVQEALCVIENILDKEDEGEFALEVHRTIVKGIVNNTCDPLSFDRVYLSILPKYEESVLDVILEDISAEDNRKYYYYSMESHLGSGFGEDGGPLFKCNNDKLKEACEKYPSVLPARLAHMCPVFEHDENGHRTSFGSFFLWLCDNYGEQINVLHEFESNLGTYSWYGVDGFSDYIAEKLPCINQLINHENPTVRKWAISLKKSVIEQVQYEQGHEAYERMVR